MEKCCCLAPRLRVCAAIGLSLLFFFCMDAGAAFFEKQYRVETVRGEEILCDPYVVQKNDWVYKILRQRGEIAYKDFPRFLELFSILNPGIENIDRIYPGQKVLIPLRILAPGAFEGQATGIVTLPVITISHLPEIVETYSTPYTVRYGDWVSRLIAQRFGPVGTPSHDRGMELFKKFNPEIENINFILAGQTIRLPDPDIMDAPADMKMIGKKEAVIDLTGFSVSAAEETLSVPEPVMEPAEAEAQPDAPVEPPLVIAEAGEPTGDPVLPLAAGSAAKKPLSLPLTRFERALGFKDPAAIVKAAAILDADVIITGDYYFPRDGQSDFRLALSETPLMVFPGDITLLLTKREWLPPEDQKVIERFRPDMKIVFFDSDVRLRPLVETILPLIDTGGGVQRHLNLSQDGISVVLRGQYIYDPPGRHETICLSILENEEMIVPRGVRDYFRTMGITVRDWVEGEGRSGWASAAAPGIYPAPESGRIPAGPARDFVKGLLQELGYRYQPNVIVSFPYAGFQVNARADLLTLPGGSDVLIDYGDLGGDAVASIEKTGLRVFQFRGLDNPGDIIARLSDLLPIESSPDPIFWTAARPRLYNPSIQIPGFLLRAMGQGTGAVQNDSHGTPENGNEKWLRQKRQHAGPPETGTNQAGPGKAIAAGAADGYGTALMLSMVFLPEPVAAFLYSSGIRVVVVENLHRQ